jgi:hypothetical protein
VADDRSAISIVESAEVDRLILVVLLFAIAIVSNRIIVHAGEGNEVVTLVCLRLTLEKKKRKQLWRVRCAPDVPCSWKQPAAC